jgi:hypothetical protein
MVDQSEKTIYSNTSSDLIVSSWSPRSQTYAAADTLLRHLKEGWTLHPLVAVESIWHAGVRRVDVYYFTLLHGDAQLEMPVLANPVVFRLIEEHKLSLVRVNGTPTD